MRVVQRTTVMTVVSALPALVTGVFACLAPACIDANRSGGSTPEDTAGAETSTCAVDPCIGVALEPCMVGRANYPDCTICEPVPVADDTPCDDGNRCTVEDRCESGACQASPVDPAVACDDHNACTDDACDPERGCTHASAPLDGTRCDDGNSCTHDEICQGGACRWQSQYGCSLCSGGGTGGDDCEAAHGDHDRCNGVVACDASLCLTDTASIPRCDAPADPCNPFVCSPSDGTCVHAPLADGTSCSDLSSCTVGDACQDGVCVGTPVADARCACSDDSQCTWLDDGDLCNGRMRCRDHVCVFDFDSPVTCDAAANPCEVSACDPADGLCHAHAIDDGAACDDQSHCTSDDHCEAGKCVGAAVDCHGLDTACAVGSCDAQLGCQVVPRSAPPVSCETGIACRLGTCQGTECVDNGQGCDDHDPCTADSCDRVNAKCVNSGPPRPSCATSGACAAGVPVVCVGGHHYECDYASVPEYHAVDVCESDSNCDGVADSNCVPPDVDGCPAGSGIAAAWNEGAVLACAKPGVAGDESCQAGWHACTYSELSEATTNGPPPRGYYLAAKITWTPADGYAIADTNGACVPFGGFCALGTTTQAMTWDHVYKDAIVYAAEAWRCEGGPPDAQCGDKNFDGVMCCANRCQSGSECDDHDDCTQDDCDTSRGLCRHVPRSVTTACPTEGVCASAELACNVSGHYECALSAVAGYEHNETLCDGLDNDCDGKTDAADPDFPAEGPPCELTAGVCAGVHKPRALCAEGRWLACTSADYESVATYEPGGETRCDGLDNDCDGRTDDGFLYQGKAIGETCTGVGACGVGKVVCGPDARSATCSTNPNGTTSGAHAEACNGLDDDCDGVTDNPEALPPSLAGCAHVGVCAEGVPAECAGASGWRCDYASVPGYLAGERCDGLDNDCNGLTDEGFHLVDGGVTRAIGAACGNTCAGARVVCTADGEAAVCSSDVGAGIELCDGLDNDCDGQTDEGITLIDGGVELQLGDDCPPKGICGAGKVECGPGHVAVCSTRMGGSASEARVERCNGLDDDCDGQTDELFFYDGARVGAPCDGRGECGAGVVVCADETRATCSTNPDGVASQAHPETCNGKDDDCDGQTDDGVTPGPTDCPFTGVCTPQSVVATCDAGHWHCDFSANPDYHAGSELGHCDGRDNNCDGQTDEDYLALGLGQACDGPDADQCKRGHAICASDGASLACIDDVAQLEVCGGGDENCDGRVDEPGALGCLPYYVDADNDGWGVAGDTVCLCAKIDHRAAQAGDCDDTPGTGAARHPQAAELCNGIDDDCDGKTDAADPDLLVGDPQPCLAGGGQGVCHGATKPAALCVSGHWGECTSATYRAWSAAYETSEASCDGLDNDCDGNTDARDPDIAAVRPACALQQGVCGGARAPTSACTASGWAACDAAAYALHDPAFQTNESTCDALDNDCDGQTDEGFAWEGLAPGAACTGHGACAIPGHVECTASGTQAICSSQPGGSAPGPFSAEVCNGSDDDCDGATDEGLTVADSPCRIVGVCSAQNVHATCTGVQGWVCGYGAVDGYEDGAETRCDGRDNDCDGQTDEDMVVASGVGQGLHKGAPCGTQGNGCGGTVVCAPDQTLVCSTTLAGGAEVCDGADNDCDGQTDEGFAWNGLAVGAACDGVGECGLGVVECDGLQAARCSTNPGGSHAGGTTEICDGKDNDCDGSTDEGFTWNGLALGAGCDGTGACGLGTVVCAVDHAHATCSTNPDAPNVTVSPETCNGLDDDCDGQTDEGLGIADSNCRLVGVCDASNVAATCNGSSGWSCDYSKVPYYHAGDEVGYCDGLDNDCDGQTDEDYKDVLGQPCDGPDADLCAHGTWQCPETVVLASFAFGDPMPPVIEPDGQPICVGDAQSDEVCGDHVDNDCDGLTDEAGARGCQTYFRDGDHDTWGVLADARCLCAPDGVYTAQRLQNDCDDAVNAVNPGATEACDGIDNDCDGQTDEPGATSCRDFYHDADHDSFGVDGDTRCLCDKNDGEATDYTAEVGGDCDDGNEKVNPGQVEVCNGGVDDNCDGIGDPVGADGCSPYYTDLDVDGYGTSPSQCRCLPSSPYTSSRSDDCCDRDANAVPAQGAYFDTPTGCGSYDYDCNGKDEPQWNALGTCKCAGATQGICPLHVTGCIFAEGWDAKQIPACGATVTYILKCEANGVGCSATTESRKQRCH